MNKLVLWDFDGVIVPSFNAGLETYQKFDPNYTEEEYRKGYEGNIFRTSKLKNVSEKDFHAEYHPRTEKLGLVDQIDEAVKTTTQKYASIIVSSSHTSTIETFLDRHSLRSCFQKIYGNDVHYSKIEKIGMALNEFESDNKNSVFITDTLGDIREAEAHDMKTIGVTWGFHPKETLEKGKPDVIIDSPKQLIKEVERLLK